MDKAVGYLKGKGLKFLGEPTVMTAGPSAGETWGYFLSPWGMNLELVSYSQGQGIREAVQDQAVERQGSGQVSRRGSWCGDCRVSASRLTAWVVALLLLGAGATARAHIPAGYDLRVVHFVRMQDGLHAYYRLTLPLVVANRLGTPSAPTATTSPRPSSCCASRAPTASTIPMHRVSAPSRLALGRFIADGHRLEVDAQAREPQVLSVRAYPKGSVPPFNTLEEAQRATATRARLSAGCAGGGRGIRSGGCASALSDGRAARLRFA